MTSEWDTLTTDFKSGLWMHSFCQIPFLDAQFKRFGEEQGGAPWKALDVGCGMGKHTMRLLQAGASYVLAFDVSKEMVAGAKMEADKFLHSQMEGVEPKFPAAFNINQRRMPIAMI